MSSRRRSYSHAVAWVSGLAWAAGCLTPALAEGRRHRVGSADIAVNEMGSAGPVVVLEAGRGKDMQSWALVAPALASCMRVIRYDRPGIGGSAASAPDQVVLADTVADQLLVLLRTLDLAPPYILVGHSLGGLYVQAFARLHPTATAAVVLVDATSPAEPPGVFVSPTPPASGTVAAAEEAGVPPSIAAMNSGPPFPPVPLIVLAATDHGDTLEREALWRDVQVRTAALSPRGRLIVVEGSGHFVQQDKPAAVIQAVLQAAEMAGFDTSDCRA
ncbi:2-succinyl-6-hydroxy-2, 4-cyclohexadiene-1-carboxylate synthase [Methylobacterium isbiliense]|uniref:2-succinyl-6-hydroxy-2, 4-cyclohexadiene-1-carboxylate synthase n=2 Tax=Methylobacteriaceae TaxID=119045 RepID=A0ABQ4SI66_9HYPH|nr:2-succinyl-6-hydroxy-2, 4-cyclohexadiene-1-carboxylate synthase [Methylobacterium isbiliense]